MESLVAAGVPKAVFNMDSRAGAISEAFEAEADPDPEDPFSYDDLVLDDGPSTQARLPLPNLPAPHVSIQSIAGATVAAEKFGEQTRKFLEWNEITEPAREGRRIQARWLLERYRITKSLPEVAGRHA